MNRTELAHLVKRAKQHARVQGRPTKDTNDGIRIFLQSFQIPKHTDRSELHKVRCSGCNKTFNLLVKAEDLRKFWRKESTITAIFPYLNSDDLVLLTDKMCPECKAKL